MRSRKSIANALAKQYLNGVVYENTKEQDEDIRDAMVEQNREQRRALVNLRPGSGRAITRHKFHIHIWEGPRQAPPPPQPQLPRSPVNHRFMIRQAPSPPAVKAPAPAASASASGCDNDGDCGYDCEALSGGNGSEALSGRSCSEGGSEALSGRSGSEGGSEALSGGSGSEALSGRSGSDDAASSSSEDSAVDPAVVWEDIARKVAAGEMKYRDWLAVETAAKDSAQPRNSMWSREEERAVWTLLLQTIRDLGLTEAAYPAGSVEGRPVLANLQQERAGGSAKSLWMNLAVRARIKGCNRTLNSIKSQMFRYYAKMSDV